jgi:uncharacterized protein YjbI with pentapeptide repeats
VGGVPCSSTDNLLIWPSVLTTLRDAIFVRCTFVGSDLSYVDFGGVSFTQCQFLGVSAVSGEFGRARFIDVAMGKCVFRDCGFIDSVLCGVTLTGCEFDSCDLMGQTAYNAHACD